jgi:hypothetical protein
MSDDFKLRFPTQDDLAREQVRRRGLLYFGDVQEQIRARLDQLLPQARKAFALSCADRLMRTHESQPPDDQRPFTLGWRPTLNAMWEGLAVESEDSASQVKAALDAFHSSEFDAQDGPDDADEDAAASSIYACECYLSGDQQMAYWASARAIEAVFRIAEDELQLDPNDFTWDPGAEPMPFAMEAMHPVVQKELATQRSDLSMLEEVPFDRSVIARLRG